MTNDYEVRVCSAMAELKADVIRSDEPKEAAIWEWAEEVAIPYAFAEAREDFEASPKPLRALLANDMAYRIGEQLVAMAGDVAPSEPDYQEAKDNLRLAPKIAARLRQQAGAA